MRLGTDNGLLSTLMEEAISRAGCGTATHLVFEHAGRLGDDAIQRLLDVTEQNSLAAGDPVPIRKRLFSVLVEGLENIQKHAMEDHQDTATAALVRCAEGYTLLLGNAMPLIMATILEQRVELLNEMSELELKEYYLKVLSNDGRTNHGGAGLGLLTMARRSTRPIVFLRTTLDATTAFAVLQLKIAIPAQ